MAVPVVDGEPRAVVCHVDATAHQRMVSAKGAVRGLPTKLQRLEGLIPNPQEFHKRMLTVQVKLQIS